MTDGTSQGLFIVVAIVIFGIFVVLAYILFEDTLRPAMANMFSQATEQATERVKYNSKLTKKNITDYTHSLSAYIVNHDVAKGIYTVAWDGTSTGYWGDNNPTGIRAENRVKIGWGERMTVMFDVLTTQDAVVSIDFNASRSGSHSTDNDHYGTNSGIDSKYTENIKANQKKTITYFLVNNNEYMNPQHLDLNEHSVLGLEKRFLINGETFEISNIRYAITKE